jgi:hypothetical protein
MKAISLPSALSHLDSSRREEVLELIEQIEGPSSRKNLLSSLKKLVGIPARPKWDSEVGQSGAIEVEQFNQSEGVEAIRKEVFRILSDNELFATNAELARAIERELRVSMTAASRNRESRQKMIQNAWDVLVAQKDSAFRSRVTRFLAKFGPSQDDYYKKLFDLLSRRE